MNPPANRQSGNDMLHADSGIAIPVFPALRFSEGSYAGSKGMILKSAETSEQVAEAL